MFQILRELSRSCMVNQVSFHWEVMLCKIGGIPKRAESSLSKSEDGKDAMSDKENVSKQSKEGEGGEKKEGGNKLTAQNVFLTSLAMKKQYFMSRMINWHPNMKVELAKVRAYF